MPWRKGQRGVMSLCSSKTNFWNLELGEGGQSGESYGRCWSAVGCHFLLIDFPSKFDVHCPMKQRTPFPKGCQRLGYDTEKTHLQYAKGVIKINLWSLFKPHTSIDLQLWQTWTAILSKRLSFGATEELRGKINTMSTMRRCPLYTMHVPQHTR